MSIFRKTFSGCVVLMSSLLIISCNQASDEQASTSQTESTVIASKSGPSVGLSTSDITVYKGDSFSLDITMSDFVTTEGGGITLRFDPALLQVLAVNVDSTVWGFINKDGRINNAEGTISDILFSSYQGVASDTTIASIEFQSIEKGTSTITLEESSANPFASDGQNMNVVFKTTEVSSN
ncbi:MAG: cohesin domain-containing protein [Gammaproteobacteria bacterium]|nr:cohesin domain-containing protein [Gammaproteobacteria bacterium]